MAISIIQPIMAVSVAGGFDIPTLPYNEANSATFKNGAVLVGSTNATLIEATSGAPPILKIVGIASQAGTNNASAPAYPNYGGTYPAGSSVSQATPPASVAEAVTPLLVQLAAPGVIFEATMANAGNDYAPVASDVFVRYGLTKDATSGFWYVDKALTTTNSNVFVTEIKNVQDIVLGTTVGVRVRFIFLAAGTAIGAIA